MAIPTFVGTERLTSTTNQATHTVNIPDDTTDGVANDDVIVVFCGRDQQTATPSGPSSPSYASGGWTVDIDIENSTFSELIAYTCKITDATALPTSDPFTTGGNRKCEWWARAINGADYDNLEVFTKQSTGNVDLAGGTTTNDDNLILGGTSSFNADKNDPGDITTEGSWTIEHEGVSSSGSGPDGGLSVCSITQASAGVLSDQEIETTGGSDEWSSGTIVLPGIAAAAAVYPPFPRRQNRSVRM